MLAVTPLCWTIRDTGVAFLGYLGLVILFGSVQLTKASILRVLLWDRYVRVLVCVLYNSQSAAVAELHYWKILVIILSFAID